MSITVDTVQLKFSVKPSYEQQQIQKLSADLKQATANYAALGKAAKDNAKAPANKILLNFIRLPSSFFLLEKEFGWDLSR